MRAESLFGLEIGGDHHHLLGSSAPMAPLGAGGGGSHGGNRLRPLSIASTSSTSTTSSSHHKHPSNSYLASAESLQDGTFSPISDDEGDVADRLRYTDNVAHEVLETERAYVHDLGVVIQGYQRPMRECGVTEGFVSNEDLAILFGNLDQILQLHSTFLERLTSECSRRLLSRSGDMDHTGSNAVAIAECFVAQFGAGQGVQVYANYCTNYPRSLQVLSRLVKPDTRSCALLSKLQLGLGHRMQLGSYLLKPVQRILKYPLLLDALRHFEKDYPGCAGQNVIEQALRTMQQIANRINEIKKLDEDAVRVQEIQSVLQGWPGNDLTTYGGLVAEEKVICSKKHLMHIFLFEKILLITKRKRKSPNLLWYVQHIATNDLMVNESSWMVVGDCSFQVLSKSNRQLTYVFETTGRERKKLWCDRLNKIILDSLDIPAEQRSKILENLRRERNLNYNLSKREHNNSLKAHKKSSRGLDSLKKATNILHRRRASVDNSSLRPAASGLATQSTSEIVAGTKNVSVSSSASLRINCTDHYNNNNNNSHNNNNNNNSHNNSHNNKSVDNNNSHSHSHSHNRSSSSSTSQSSYGRSSLKLKSTTSKFAGSNEHGKLRRCHSQAELHQQVQRGRRREPSLSLTAGTGRSGCVVSRRSSSLPRWMKINGLKSQSKTPCGGISDAPRSRQWKHLLFTMGSRLRTSLLSTDSGASSSSATEPRRPASMDSALFYTNSESEDDDDDNDNDNDEQELDDEQELESNNSSGSFYERNFELCCRDEIFRDSAIFSEDTISEISAEFLMRDYGEQVVLTGTNDLKHLVRQLNEVDENGEIGLDDK